MINSRRKGAKNERLVSKLFEEWTGKKFAKSPASGGLNWNTANVSGDIVCCTEGHYFPFCVEAKFHDKIDFSDLLKPGIKNVDILTWWKQAESGAKKVNKIPILMMRYNGLKKDFHFIVINNIFMNDLWQFFSSRVSLTTINYHDKKRSLVIMRSTDFFQLPYREIRKLTKNLLKNAKR